MSAFTILMLYHIISQGVLEWKRSREFFYWRMRRRLLESSVKKRLVPITEAKSDGELNSMLSRWFVEDKGTVNVSGRLNGLSVDKLSFKATHYHEFSIIISLLFSN